MINQKLTKQQERISSIRRIAMKKIRKQFHIISGGQTGVDRAVLDFALQSGMTHSGWCPRGRWSESGRIPDQYCLKESSSRDPARRTFLNVRDSDLTLILVTRSVSRGTLTTLKYASILNKPVVVIRSAEQFATCRQLIDQIDSNPVRVNFAGPRESESPGVYDWSRALIEKLFAEI